MSHQTGIKANQELKAFFGKCREGDTRIFKVSIVNGKYSSGLFSALQPWSPFKTAENGVGSIYNIYFSGQIWEEELCLVGKRDTCGQWEEDFSSLVLPFVEPGQPCYLFFRLDTKDGTGAYNWMLISWSPDDAPVRQKMLYASTKATLKQEFGSGQIKEELHGTVEDDVTLKGLHRHVRNEKAPAPLTTREEELAELRKVERGSTHVNIDSRHQTLSGVAFQMNDEAHQALYDLSAKVHNYVQLRIDLNEEKIYLAEAGNISLSSLPSRIPSDTARYHLYNFCHTHEGDYLESIVFIYSMPGYSCSIKERMLYSSGKAPLLESIESLNIPIAKKLEIEAGSELTEEFLQEELHPKKNLHRPQFAKPKGPPNRGAKRLTKPQVSTTGN